MRRRIVGFVADEVGDWVALLDCHHRQHVRHRPPFRVAPWVEDEAGRAWAAEVLHTAKHEGYAALWARLTAWRAGLRGPQKRAAADGLLHYVAKREEGGPS